jgi:hypothetical protein
VFFALVSAISSKSAFFAPSGVTDPSPVAVSIPTRFLPAVPHFPAIGEPEPRQGFHGPAGNIVPEIVPSVHFFQELHGSSSKCRTPCKKPRRRFITVTILKSLLPLIAITSRSNKIGGHGHLALQGFFQSHHPIPQYGCRFKILCSGRLEHVAAYPLDQLGRAPFKNKITSLTIPLYNFEVNRQAAGPQALAHLMVNAGSCPVAQRPVAAFSQRKGFVDQLDGLTHRKGR